MKTIVFGFVCLFWAAGVAVAMLESEEKARNRRRTVGSWMSDLRPE